jgi:pyrimidine deaminase RibD-like protein
MVTSRCAAITWAQPELASRVTRPVAILSALSRPADHKVETDWMNKVDDRLIAVAIRCAKRCKPIGLAIPRVGAVIAIGPTVIGRGQRGTGAQEDDEHAEWNALRQVKDKTRLPQSTLYTTLEPCTKAVRTRPLESCTELILQHQIPRVVVGMLDPNQEVTGKGLWRLQEGGVDVSLFPHKLAQQVRALNTEFIRFQEGLGARIISPVSGEELHIDVPGRHLVRFASVNPPTSHQFLLCLKAGLCWPQASVFRPGLEPGTWEVDAHFGSMGEHTLHLVTAVDLGISLITYYQKVLERNRVRKRELETLVPKDHRVLKEGTSPGIPMPVLPKGLRSEASITVTVKDKLLL